MNSELLKELTNTLLEGLTVYSVRSFNNGVSAYLTYNNKTVHLDFFLQDDLVLRVNMIKSYMPSAFFNLSDPLSKRLFRRWLKENYSKKVFPQTIFQGLFKKKEKA